MKYQKNKERHNFSGLTRRNVHDGFLEVVEYFTPLLYSQNQAAEVIIEQNH